MALTSALPPLALPRLDSSTSIVNNAHVFPQYHDKSTYQSLNGVSGFTRCSPVGETKTLPYLQYNISYRQYALLVAAYTREIWGHYFWPPRPDRTEQPFSIAHPTQAAPN